MLNKSRFLNLFRRKNKKEQPEKKFEDVNWEQVAANAEKLPKWAKRGSLVIVLACLGLFINTSINAWNNEIVVPDYTKEPDGTDIEHIEDELQKLNKKYNSSEGSINAIERRKAYDSLIDNNITDTSGWLNVSRMYPDSICDCATVDEH